MITEPSLFEVILFEFLHFSISKIEIMSTYQFPLYVNSECDYSCTHYSSFDDNKIIIYTFEELFE